MPGLLPNTLTLINFITLKPEIPIEDKTSGIKLYWGLYLDLFIYTLMFIGSRVVDKLLLWICQICSRTSKNCSIRRFGSQSCDSVNSRANNTQESIVFSFCICWYYFPLHTAGCPLISRWCFMNICSTALKSHSWISLEIGSSITMLQSIDLYLHRWT